MFLVALALVVLLFNWKSVLYMNSHIITQIEGERFFFPQERHSLNFILLVISQVFLELSWAETGLHAAQQAIGFQLCFQQCWECHPLPQCGVVRGFKKGSGRWEEMEVDVIIMTFSQWLKSLSFAAGEATWVSLFISNTCHLRHAMEFHWQPDDYRQPLLAVYLAGAHLLIDVKQAVFTPQVCRTYIHLY